MQVTTRQTARATTVFSLAIQLGKTLRSPNNVRIDALQSKLTKPLADRAGKAAVPISSSLRPPEEGQAIFWRALNNRSRPSSLD
jgi:hypothetical protein